MSPKKPIAYTFGNHMHWVDMEWLWGYSALPSSVRDMLDLCQSVGVRGNVNFDAVGYEKLASESPEAFADLRAAVQKGIVEIVGGTYAQPYGGFHGGESNIRHRTFGHRTIRRLFRLPVTTFWEQEFDFFPQLPQILKQCGFTSGSIHFGWTWHTPTIPLETEPVVEWQSPDGSTLKVITNNLLAIPRRSEEFDTLAGPLEKASKHPFPPLVLQWTELLPSTDWMCRKEQLAARLKAFVSDPNLEVRRTTLGQYLRDPEITGPIRRYHPDEVFHGVTLGKNGDVYRRLSQWAEGNLLTAEAMTTMASWHGRPYPQWDVYPAWEIEEAWRELMVAQHHDNDLCEGLCGGIGEHYYQRSLWMSMAIIQRTGKLLASRIQAETGHLIVFNPLGWPVTTTVAHPVDARSVLVQQVPAFGWTVVDPDASPEPEHSWHLTGFGAEGIAGSLTVRLDHKGRINTITSPHWPGGALAPDTPLLDFWCQEASDVVHFHVESMEVDVATDSLIIRFQHPEKGGIRADIRLAPEAGALDITLSGGSLKRMDPGMNAGLRTRFSLKGGIEEIVTDSPYAFHSVEGTRSFQRKYPSGDWMTSPQWFEPIHRPIHALSSIDLLQGGRGLLVIHDGSQQWFRTDRGLEVLLTCYDPWDEEYWVDRFRARFRIIPHGRMTHSERYKAARTFLQGVSVALKEQSGGDLPTEWSLLPITQGPGIVTALYREPREHGEGYDRYLPRRFNAELPILMRTVEFDGEGGPMEWVISGQVEDAGRVNLLGEAVEGEIEVDAGATHTAVRGDIRAYEIQTVAMDLRQARKQFRNLDDYQKVWTFEPRTL